MVFCLAPLALHAQSTSIQLTTHDDLTLAGTYYNPGQPGPGVLLLHQCNRDRLSWHDLAQSLMQSGYHVLTFDYRGYGESEGENPPWAGFDDALARWGDDLERAYAFLRQQPGVQGNRLGLGGASCGVFMALELTRRHPDAVQTLVLLSGGVNDRVIDFLKTAKDVPVYSVVSAEDGSLGSMRRIIEATPHPGSRLITLRSAGHGTDMFATQNKLMPELTEWFKTHLVHHGR